MLNTQASPGVFPSVIDSTIRADFVSCPTKFYWSHCRQIGPSARSVDLIAGGAFARGLEVTRRTFWGKGKPFSQSLDEGMAAAIAEWGDFVITDPKKENKSLERVISALGEYFIQWPIKTDPIQPYFWDEGKPAVEYTFAIPLPILHPVTNEPLIYAGRLDLIGIFNAQVFLVDEKTTSQLGPTWGEKWNLRSQFTGYAWAARHTGLPVAGAIVRGISFLKNSFGFAQSIQFRPQWQVERWYEQLVFDIEAMKSYWLAGRFPQNLADSCESYSGCPFMRLCESSTPEDWMSSYSPRAWNPLDRYPSGKPAQEAGELTPLGFTLT